MVPSSFGELQGTLLLHASAHHFSPTVFRVRAPCTCFYSISSPTKYEFKCNGQETQKLSGKSNIK